MRYIAIAIEGEHTVVIPAALLSPALSRSPVVIRTFDDALLLTKRTFELRRSGDAAIALVEVETR